MRITRLLLFGLLMTVGFFPSFAQKGKKKKKGMEEVKTEKPMTKKPPMKKRGAMKSIKDVVKKCREIDGFFTIYQDTTSGSIYLKVKKEQVGQEFIYVSMLENGVTAAGGFRGAYRDNSVYSIRKEYNRLEFVKENTSFYFDKENALSRAADANISTATVISEKIVAQDSSKENYLIKADGMFMSEAMTIINRTYFSPRGFKLGRINKSKSKYIDIRSFPKNTELVVEYVFDNSRPRSFGGSDVTDARYVSIKAQHSFIAMPDNDFEPRFDDPRVGFFTQTVNDMTATDATPYRDMINRWDLVKKDPTADLSEPVEPITWWIENTTPEELREGVKEGILGWNKAFEKAGFKNAMVVKVQPDDADWTAGDIRYNVIRWTASPYPPFRGYGPSFVNPRTGQILGADIMLDYSAFKRIYLNTKPFDNASASFLDVEDHDSEEGHVDMPGMEAHKFCMAGNYTTLDNMFAEQIMRFDGADAQAMKAMEYELLVRLVMHEVGHTLGLMHNMKGSQMLSPEELNNKEITREKGLTNTVMDYPMVNVSRDRSKQGDYYSMSTGPYDWWIIEYGYRPGISEKALNDIAARSTEADLMFGNDADRIGLGGVDPYTSVYDMSNDVVAYSAERMMIVNDMMKNLKQKYAKDGETYQELLFGYNILWRQYWISAGNIANYIGGVKVDRAFQGQKGATKPLTPVSEAYQKKAMAALAKHVFAPDAYKVPEDLLNHLQIQRRGFNFFGRTENPEIHQDVLAIQRNALRRMLRPNVLRRLIDSEMYGNEYKISEFMTELNDAIFKADATTNINTYRQNLQLAYVKMLSNMVVGEFNAFYPNMAKSMAVYNLKQIRKIATNGRGDTLTRAHKDHLKLLIDKTLEK